MPKGEKGEGILVPIYHTHDQNSDGSCTPADFTAWIANYNAGCD